MYVLVLYVAVDFEVEEEVDFDVSVPSVAGREEAQPMIAVLLREGRTYSVRSVAVARVCSQSGVLAGRVAWQSAAPRRSFALAHHVPTDAMAQVT